tara:strand:- start:1811 stop:2200 length:390 start_codon:yes stop_codon:yes gene_type:complete
MERIIFFDGLCPFCHFWVRFVLKRDRKNHFLFAPLQGETAQLLLSPEWLDVNTVVLLENKKKVYTKSKAVFQIINTLGGLRKILLIFNVIPRKILDLLYDFVSRNRFLLWKPLESCPVPSRKDAAKFLA